MFEWQADFFADLARNQLVVTGKHFNRYAVLLKSGDRRRRCFLRRVEERHVAFQDKVVFVVFAVNGLGIAVRVSES
jgi:hypothetical protein